MRGSTHIVQGCHTTSKHWHMAKHEATLNIWDFDKYLWQTKFLTRLPCLSNLNRSIFQVNMASLTREWGSGLTGILWVNQYYLPDSGKVRGWGQVWGQGSVSRSRFGFLFWRGTDNAPPPAALLRHVKFRIQNGSDWPQMANQNVLKLILKSPRFVPFETNLT